MKPYRLIFLTTLLINTIASSLVSADEKPNMEIATFGAGCYWCVESVFAQVPGVSNVTAGFMGGHFKNPTYKQVKSGRTGHAEVVRIAYDPTVVSFDQLLLVFWQTHDPTALNYQGPDRGTQYRSVIFYRSPAQKETAKRQKAKLNRTKTFGKRVVTQIEEESTFYPAGEDHQDYFEKNPLDLYCQRHIPPKLEKLKKILNSKPHPE